MLMTLLVEKVPGWQVFLQQFFTPTAMRVELVLLGAIVLTVMVVKDLKRKAKAQQALEDAYGLPRPPS
jgi:heme/copper-type cytochrome/quinol oxidase subunit 3